MLRVINDRRITKEIGLNDLIVLSLVRPNYNKMGLEKILTTTYFE